MFGFPFNSRVSITVLLLFLRRSPGVSPIASLFAEQFLILQRKGARAREMPTLGQLISRNVNVMCTRRGLNENILFIIFQSIFNCYRMVNRLSSLVLFRFLENRRKTIHSCRSSNRRSPLSNDLAGSVGNVDFQSYEKGRNFDLTFFDFLDGERVLFNFAVS